MPITTLLFDLDDTLTDDTTAVEMALATTARIAQQQRGIDPAAFIHSLRAIVGELWRSSPNIAYCQALGVSSWEGLCTTYLGTDPSSRALQTWAPIYQAQAWTDTLALYEIDDESLARELASTYTQERLTYQHLFPEVEEVLERLAPFYQLGLITNGASDLQRRKIQRAQLDRFFQVMVVSEEMGIGKPHPQIFLQTLSTLGSDPASAVMLGDNPSRDILGANNAGLKSIWVNRSNKVPEGDVLGIPDAEVADFLLLEEVLKTL